MKTIQTESIDRHAGFSLIELLVSMAIGLIVTLAIASVLIRSEGSKRSSTSVNDINQTGAYLTYVMDRAIRNAGSGFSQKWSTLYGCRLNASKSGTQVLPPAFAPSSAFANVTQQVRLAPVVIGKGLADNGGAVRGDVLLVMGGMAGAGEVPFLVNPGFTSANPIVVPNTLGLQIGGIVLLADPGVPNGCMLQQIATTFAPQPLPPPVPLPTPSQTVPLGGTYYTTSGVSASLGDFQTGALNSTLLVQLGIDGTNPPKFQAFGVGNQNTLVNYDLLQADGNEQSIADGVVEMRALYGLDTTSPPDGVLDSWVQPTGAFSAATLMDGSAASQANLRKIVAVRIGFFLRTSLQERPQDYTASTTTLTLFGDLTPATLHQTRSLTGTDVNYRWRTMEVTVPLVNVLDSPQS